MWRGLKAKWESMAPNKVKSLDWPLLQFRLPTQGNLARSGIINGRDVADWVWHLCVTEAEDHLF